jgi:hypothetical protein
VPGGILCDDDVLVCAPGTQCGQVGICESVVVEDAGVPDSGVVTPDAGMAPNGGEEEDYGCTCAKPQNHRATAYLLPLVAAWFILRRRGR